MALSSPSWIGSRYHLLEASGNYVVASDRLRDTQVAIWPVASPPEATRRSLMRDIATLARLRHANLLEIIDYGYDSRGPYYVTPLHREAALWTSISAAAEKVGALLQVLRGLVYLHTNGLLHRALRPEHLLVLPQNRIKLTTYGFPALPSAYTAPEVRRGELERPTADLYAFGMLAYELFTGELPSPPDSEALINELDAMFIPGMSTALSKIIMRLLAANPAERYADAAVVLNEIGLALVQPQEPESAGLLPTPRFVGRKQELQTFNAALMAMKRGQGTSLQVNGERGVGKTRLMDEFALHALSQDTLVLRGRPVRDYSAWREPLRRLLLFVEPTELESTALAPFLGDFNETASGGPRLDPAFAMVSLFGRLDAPTTVLIDQPLPEDEPLIAALAELAPKRRLLLVVNSVDPLPELSRLPLLPMEDEEVATLAEVLLGGPGVLPRVVDLLRRESEGYPYRLIEIVRGLVELAGSVADVGRTTLTRALFDGDFQLLIRRRLAQLAPEARVMLTLTAAAGEALDLDLLRLLRAASPGLSLEDWLANAAQGGWFVPDGDQWRFSHTPLRDALEAELDSVARPLVHRRIAEASEALYEDRDAASLALHWRAAGESDRAAHYTALAAERAIAAQQPSRAIRLCESALTDFGMGSSARIPLLYLLGRASLSESAFEQAATCFAASLRLAEDVGDPDRAGQANIGLSQAYTALGSYPAALAALQAALAAYQAAESARGVVEALAGLRDLTFSLGDRVAASGYHEAWLEARRSVPES